MSRPLALHLGSMDLRKSGWIGPVLALTCLSLPFFPAGAPAAEPPRLANLTADVRKHLDEAALRQAPETPLQEKVHMADDVSVWLIGRVTLPSDDELRYAKDQHKKVLAHYRTVAAPASAQKVWTRLLDTLPAYLRPVDFAWTLTILDFPQPTCFTIGGGYVYLSRPLLDSLLSSQERGPAALAYLLAREIGHMSLRQTRRGWLSIALDEEQRDQAVELRLPARQLQLLLETSIDREGDQVRFRYTRRQQYDADRFALHLCRNAGLDQDQATDGMRLLTALDQPRLVTDPNYKPEQEPEEDRSHHQERDPLFYPAPLKRLQALIRERKGLVDDDNRYGLFVYDRERDEPVHCAEHSVAASARPIIFVHGLHGTLDSFEDYVHACDRDRELQGRPLLLFRYPNNDSLSRCGEYLAREMARVVADPRKAFFVCHSAGGLVFRYYAEVKKGAFDRAVLLSTPNEGSHLGSLKFLADVVSFAGELRGGMRGVVSRTVEEGHGAILYDLHPDSLFLRYLGHNKELAARYHVFSGEPLRRVRILALGAGLLAAKHFLQERAVPEIRSPLLRRLANETINDWRLPPEITAGDLVVSARSAQLEDAGHVTRTSLRHEAFMHDPEVIDEVITSILNRTPEVVPGTEK